ncbi:MAG TPA: thioredoxin domain-containing protein [Candidatus Paceibacterota bacterium]
MEPQNETPQTNNPETVSKKPTLSLPAAVLTGFALIALAILLTVPGLKKAAEAPAPAAGTPSEMPTSIPAELAKIQADDHVQGDRNAAVIVIEYSDTDCPFCAKFHPTLKSVVADYQGKVAWVYRHFPLDMHPNAYTEAIALECAAKLGGNGAFWGYLDEVVDITLEPDPASNNKLTAIATDMGINAEAFKRCFGSPDVIASVDANIAEAGQIGARGTPFSIAVNQKTGKQVIIPGAYPLEEVKKMIDSIL